MNKGTEKTNLGKYKEALKEMEKVCEKYGTQMPKDCPHCEPWPDRCPHCGRPYERYPYYPEPHYPYYRSPWYITYTDTGCGVSTIE